MRNASQPGLAPAGEVAQASASAAVTVTFPACSRQLMNWASSLASRSSLNPMPRRRSR